MRRKSVNWDRLVPVGLEGRMTVKQTFNGLLLAVLWSLVRFLAGYLSQLRHILENPRMAGRAVLMSHFTTLLRYSMLGFQLTAAAMVLLALYHYFHHYREGRCIYLMRRLPDKWDLWRRCLTVPALGLLGSGLLPILLTLLYFLLYRLTPQGFYDPPERQEPIYQLLCRVFAQGGI